MTSAPLAPPSAFAELPFRYGDAAPSPNAVSASRTTRATFPACIQFPVAAKPAAPPPPPDSSPPVGHGLAERGSYCRTTSTGRTFAPLAHACPCLSVALESCRRRARASRRISLPPSCPG
ncbi:hypothetical protein CDD83_8887 [Cordyceps sp. RAO-2017]|nr:hypothetical protein CDD83_8887 [Cordyceps sp. RAO-2017]